MFFFYPLLKNDGEDKYLVLGVYFADKEIEDVKVAAVEKHVDEAQHGSGAHGCSCPTHHPHDGFNHSNRQQVQTRQRGDHRVPLRKNTKATIHTTQHEPSTSRAPKSVHTF